MKLSHLPASAARLRQESSGTPFTQPPQLAFGGLYQDLLKAQGAPASTLPTQETAASTAPNEAVIQTLSAPMTEINGRSLTGAQVLEVIQEMGQAQNRKSYGSRFGYGLITASWVLTLGIAYIITAMVCEENGISEQEFYRRRGEAFRTKGISPQEVTRLFGANEKLQAGLQTLTNQGLLKTNAKGEYELTLLGRQWRKKAASGLIKATAPAQPAKVITTTPNRLDKVQALCLEANGLGLSGWDVLKKLSELQSNRSRLSRLLKRDVTEKELRLQAGGQPSPEKFKALMLTLDSLGLVQPTRITDDADTRRWALTHEAKELLKNSDAVQALQVNPQEIHQLIELQVSQLQNEKETRRKELQEVQERLQEAQKDMPALQAQWDEAERKVIELDDTLKQTATGSQHETLNDTLTESLFQAKLSEKKARFQLKKVEQLSRQLATFKAHHSRWLNQTNQTLLRLHEVLLELKDRQENHSTDQAVEDILKKLAHIDSRQTAHEESQLKELAAQVSPKPSSTVTDEAQAELAISKELDQFDLSEQITQMRQRLQQNGNALDTLAKEAPPQPQALHKKDNR